jgi:hypothetical protein
MGHLALQLPLLFLVHLVQLLEALLQGYVLRGVPLVLELQAVELGRALVEARPNI